MYVLYVYLFPWHLPSFIALTPGLRKGFVSRTRRQAHHLAGRGLLARGRGSHIYIYIDNIYIYM